MHTAASVMIKNARKKISKDLFSEILNVMANFKVQRTKGTVTALRYGIVAKYGDDKGPDFYAQLSIALKKLCKDGRLTKKGNQFMMGKTKTHQVVNKKKKPSNVKKAAKAKMVASPKKP